MEVKDEGNQAITSQPNNNQPKSGPQANQKRFRKRKQPQHSADIVFTRGASIQTMPSLSKQLKDVTECVIGLQYVWEYRSPSKSVPPHYQCKLCAVSRLQHDMLSHVKGWKHSFRYLKKVHPDKVTCEEDEAVKDPAVRKSIKEVAAEVATTEGMGQLKVILKEPCDVPAFKGFRSATPKMMPPPLPPPPGKGPMGPFGPRFPNQRFPVEFPPNEGPFSDYSHGEYGPPNFGGFPPRQGFADGDMGRRPFQDGMGRRPAGIGEGFGPESGRDDFRRGGPMEEEPGRMFPDEFQRPMGNNLMDRPVNKPLDGGNNSNALLSYLDTFRIENESDAQLVLKVTQKLTDVLMEYRLRSVSTGSTLSSFSLNSTGFSSTPSRLPSSTGRYSNSLSSSSLSGPSRYSDGPSRF